MSNALPLSVQFRLEEVCSRFEGAWKTAALSRFGPRVEEYLGDSSGPERGALFRELLLLDMHYRRQRCKHLAAEDYETRFPEEAGCIRAVFAATQTVEPGLARTEAPCGTVPLTSIGGTTSSEQTLSAVATADPCEGAAGKARFPVVPGYTILGELGRGGMGVVYMSRQIKANRVVALKMVLAAGHAGRDLLVRFKTEVEAIASLQHPNIVQVYEVGDHGGLPFFSFEYCSGGSLDKKLAGIPLQPKEAAALLEKLALGMQAAHEVGIIHRDLKPGNVLLAADGSLKIGDFGLAKKLDEASQQTQTGAVLGTPSYMAPEQAEGKKDVGPAADIYALGAILYEMLTGRPPFKAATTLDTLHQVRHVEPVAPRQLQPGTPRDLETICLKCLYKAPHNRYGSAQELAADLRRFRQDKPIRARPAGVGERAWRWCRRNAAITSVSATFAVILLAAAIVASYFAVQANHSAGDAKAALQAKQQADGRARDTALRLVKWLKRNPELLRKPSKELVENFLEANPDLTIEDVSHAFADGADAGGAASTFSPGLFGD